MKIEQLTPLEIVALRKFIQRIALEPLPNEPLAPSDDEARSEREAIEAARDAAGVKS